MKTKTKPTNKTGSITTAFNVIILFFTLAGIWAYNSEIDQVVRAEAQVEPAGKVQKVQSRYPGSVYSINAEVGSEIKKGDTLVELDVEETKILKKSIEKKITLLNEKQDLYLPLVERGIEPKMTLIDMKQKVADLEEKLLRHDLQIKNSSIVANAGGVITAVHTTGVGEVLKGGEVLMEIVPESDFFIVKAKILPKDISKVSVGQEARVSYVAYDFSRYGVMPSTITKIAQNSTETKDGEMYYEAWVKTNGDTFTKDNYKPRILPGMIAQVDMLGEKRSILDYIFSPLEKGMSKALTEQ